MQVRSLALGSILAAAACHGREPAPRATSGGDPGGRIAALFDDLHRRGLFDGAVVIEQGDRALLARGYGLANVEQGVRFTPDTPVDGASLAKTFTALVVLQLAAERRLNLDEPVRRRLLPELPYPDISIRHLLSHSSGLPASYEFFDPFVPAGTVRTTEILLHALAEHPPQLAFAPGAHFEYSSFGFDLAALAAARAAGTRVDELFRARIFAPLGLRSAFLRPGRFADWPAARTRGYRRAGGRLVPHDVFDGEAFHGGSNIYLSARDLTRWNRSFAARSLLSGDALADGLTPARIGGRRSALTLLSWYHAADRSAFWYCGHLAGFHDLVFRDLAADLSIVYVSNNTLHPWLHQAIVRAVHAILAGGTPEPLDLPALATITAADSARLVGTWTVDGRSFHVDRDGPALFIQSPEGVRYRMFQVDRTSFYVPGLDLVIGFTRAATGSVARLRVSSNLGIWWGVRANR